MKSCLICNKKKLYPICVACSKNPFNVEKCRQKLSSIKDANVLKKLYDPSLPEINNLNCSKFWDLKLAKIQYLNDQDGMTKDRIKIAFKFIPKNVSKILDIGIGHGFLEELLSKRKKIKIYGNDISPMAIKNIRERFKGSFKTESLYKMNYSGNFFDAIFVLEVLEHIPPSKIFLVLSKIRRILNKKGFLILSVPMNEGLEYMSNNPSGHVRMYTEDLIRAELELAGFEIIKKKVLYAFANFYLLKTFIAKITNRWRPNNIIILARKK